METLERNQSKELTSHGMKKKKKEEEQKFAEIERVVRNEEIKEKILSVNYTYNTFRYQSINEINLSLYLFVYSVSSLRPTYRVTDH